MKVKHLFDLTEDITIESYLKKCGVEYVEEYLKGNTIEPTTNYKNINEWCELLHKYTEEGGQNINQE